MSLEIPRLHIPMMHQEDIIPFLGRGHGHWKAGYSAHALATTWFVANSFPPAVGSALNSHAIFAQAELIDCFLERLVDLRDGYKPSQTDILAIVGLPNELAVIAVEGKVEESFGQRVGEWFNGSPSRQARLSRLIHLLGIENHNIDALRYQLLHRAASAIYEAQRYRIKQALLLVHSFSRNMTGLQDFRDFANVLGIGNLPVGRILGPVLVDRVELYMCWVADEMPVNSDIKDGDAS